MSELAACGRRHPGACAWVGQVCLQPESILVEKIAQRAPYSFEQALSYGLITEDQARAMGWTPPPPVPRLRRWRWMVHTWWWEHRPHLHFGPCEDNQ